MPLETREIEVPKEFDDVLLLVLELVRDLKDKKELAVVASENLPNLMNAIQGVDQIDDELKADLPAFLKAASSRAVDIAALFLEKKEGEA